MALPLLVLAFVLLGLAYFIYENIIAPWERVELKYKLFHKRDELYRLKMEHPHEISEAAFDSALKAINGALAAVDGAVFTDLLHASRHIKKNESVRRDVDSRIRLVRNCAVPEVTRLVDASSGCLLKAVVVNSPMIRFVGLPLLRTARFLHLANRTVRKYITRSRDTVREVVYSGEDTAPRLLHDRSMRPT